MNIWDSWVRKEKLLISHKSNQFILHPFPRTAVQEWRCRLNNDAREMYTYKVKSHFFPKLLGWKSKNQWNSSFTISSELASYSKLHLGAKTYALFQYPLGSVLALLVGINVFFSTLTFILIYNSWTQLTVHHHLLFLSGQQNYSLLIWRFYYHRRRILSYPVPHTWFWEC